MTRITDNQTSQNKLYWVADNIIADDFPPVESALRDPDGLLAIGGDLTSERLINAYKSGIFPWYSSGQPVLWWSPDPRCILIPGEVQISKSLNKTLKKGIFEVTFNQSFHTVINKCAQPRNGNPDTWITDEIIEAYSKLEFMGKIISVETWHKGEIVGGLYGVTIGKVFFGESMFSNMNDASKIALVKLSSNLMNKGYKLIDCQIYSKHLQSLGAKSVSRKIFSNMLKQFCSVNDMISED